MMLKLCFFLITNLFLSNSYCIRLVLSAGLQVNADSFVVPVAETEADKGREGMFLPILLCRMLFTVPMVAKRQMRGQPSRSTL